MFHLQHLDHVALTVSDIATSVQWYRDVLGLERRHESAWGDVPAVMCAGDTCLALFAAHTDQPAAMPNADTTLIMKHLAFRVDRANFKQAQASLKQQGIPFDYGDHTISESIYFHDPDGHRLEITTYDYD